MARRWGRDWIPQDEELRELWTAIGLTPAEVETYDHLLGTGSSTASTVAKGTRRSRGRTYQTLRALVERGLVREEPSEPVEYRAVAPAEIIEILLAASKRRSGELETLLEGARRMRSQTKPQRTEEAAAASVLCGRRAVVAELVRIADGAKKRIWLAGGGEFITRIRRQKTVLGALQGAADRGVDAAIAVSTVHADPSSPSPMPELRGVRQATLPLGLALGVNLVVADAEAMVIVPRPDDSEPAHGDDFAVRLDGPALSGAVVAWVDALVRPAPTAAASPALATSEELVVAASQAKTTVRLAGAAAWLGATAGPGHALFAALRAAADRGVGVEIVTEMDPASWRLLKPLVGTCEVRACQTLPIGVFIVDGESAYVEVPRAHEGDLPTVRSSTDPLEVRHVEGLFERFWNQGVPLVV